MTTTTYIVDTGEERFTTFSAVVAEAYSEDGLRVAAVTHK